MAMSDIINQIAPGAFRECVTKEIGDSTVGMIETSEFPNKPIIRIALTEHRCTCGRLLGRFSGQAEVKCPKCGKMNVIGGNQE